MNTEREAWLALVQRANELGKRGQSVRNVAVIAPTTGTGSYAIVIEGYEQETATED